MQYLYKEGELYNFMDMETYEQIAIPEKTIADKLDLLIENTELQIVMNDGRIIGVNLPEKMKFEIIECEPGIKGDTKSGGDKTATIETGLVIRVPLFIEQGESVIVNTETKKYVSRA